MKNPIKKMATTCLISAALFPASLLADTSDSWEFGAAIYGWFPDISGTTNVPVEGGVDFTLGIGDILDNLSFTFQGSFDARKGSWGFLTDVVYLDIGNTKSEVLNGTVGGTQLPWDINGTVGVDMKSLIWSASAYYRMVDDSEKSFDLLAGLRYADVEQGIDWSFSGDIGQTPLPGRDGNASIGDSYWDFIVGMRGQFKFGQSGKWFVPYYADIGTGDSDLTWQALVGLGYSFNWGEVAAAWRYLDYELPSGKPIADMNINGPAIGVIFRW